MKRCLLILSCLTCATLAQAGPTAPAVRAEIDALLLRLERSGCQFNRNGSWHASADASTHLKRKLDYFEKHGEVTSAEQFIEQAASKSSSSGKVYLVKCGGGAETPSANWLGAQLQQVRAEKHTTKP